MPVVKFFLHEASNLVLLVLLTVLEMPIAENILHVHDEVGDVQDWMLQFRMDAWDAWAADVATTQMASSRAPRLRPFELRLGSALFELRFGSALPSSASAPPF